MATGTRFRNGGFEEHNEFCIREREGYLDAAGRYNVEIGFADIVNGLSASTIDEREVKNFILAIRIPGEITQDSVDSSSSIRYEDHRINRGVEIFCNRGTGNIKSFGVAVSYKNIRFSFVSILKFS